MMEKLALKTTYPADEEVLDKIIHGDLMPFEILIRRYNPLLYKIARSYGFNHQDAEDLMQETHVNAYRSLNKFRRESSYKTWLTRIHIHNCYHKMHSGYKKFEEPKDELADHPLVARQPIPEKLTTEHKVMNRELSNLLEKSLSELPLIYRSVFVLREIEGFSVAETSELLSITQVTTKVRLNRAKLLLQKQLERFYTSAEIFEFNLIYCDAIVQRVFDEIKKEPGW